MKKSTLATIFHLLPLSVVAFGAATQAAEYSLLPAPGVYDASDSHFVRSLTVKADGKFLVEVEEKGKPGNLHSGAGEGKLTDAPGGWRYTEGRCTMILKRAAGGVNLHVESCASDWGDVPFDGSYLLKTAQTAKNAAAPAMQNTVAQNTAVQSQQAAPANLPSRKELREKWGTVAMGKEAGKSLLVMTKRSDAATDPMLEKPASAAFILDSTAFYNELSASELAKTPIKLINIPLPAIAANEGLTLQGQCTYGKSANVVVVNNVSLAKGNQVKQKRVSAWMLDANQQAVEVKPASQVKCPKVEADI